MKTGTVTNNDQLTVHGAGTMTDEAVLDDDLLHPDEEVAHKPKTDPEPKQDPGQKAHTFVRND